MERIVALEDSDEHLAVPFSVPLPGPRDRF